MTDPQERLDVLAELAELGELEDEPDLDPHRDHVTLVVVTHDPLSLQTAHCTKVFEQVVAGIGSQTRPADRVVVIDTGEDRAAATSSAKRVARVLPETLALHHPGGFAQAINNGLQAVGPAAADGRIEWVWILHDDSAPAPDALERLLRHAAASPSATVLGPKALDFDDPRVIIEVGITTDRAGRRESWLEARELDQGQHDQPRDVLAVGSAGMLVRRDVYDRLRGFDPGLDLARDDLDFGWRAWLAGERVTVVPSATIRHARAVWRGLRVVDETHSHRRDRRNAAYVVLANATPLGFLLGLPRLALGVLARTLGHLLTRAPLAARSDIAALSLLVNPAAVLTGRRWRRGQVTMPHSSVDPLMASRTLRLRGYFQAAMDWASTGDAVEASAESGGGLGQDDETDGLSVLGSSDETTILRRLLRHPAIALALALILVCVIACRDLLGRGPLAGGRLLPVPAGSSDLWHQLLTGWHDVGAGVATTSTLWTAPLALLSTLALGKPWLVIDVLLIGLPLLCATAMWRASRGFDLDVRIRTWAAAAYALGPATVSVVNSGRFDVAWALVAAPSLAKGVVQLITRDESRRPWHCAWALGLWLALSAAFWPPLWTIVLLGVLIGGLALRYRGTALGSGTMWRLLIVLATPPALGWSSGLHLLSHPQVLLSGWGVAGDVAGVDPHDAPGLLDTLFLHSSAAVGAVWLGAPLMLAAVAAFLRRGSRHVALGCLGAAAAFTLAGVLVSRLSLGGVGSQVGAPDGYFALASLALVLAGAWASNGLSAVMQGRTFSWRQPAAVALIGITVAVPVVSAFAWMVNADPGPMHRRQTAMLPPFIVAETARTPDSRILFLNRTDASTPVSWSLTMLDGPTMGDEDIDDPMRHRLAPVIADLTSRRGTDAGELLSTFGISYIAIPSGADPSLVEALDEAPALFRVAYVGPLRLWRPTFVSARVLLLPPAAGVQALTAPDKATWAARGSGRGPTQLPRSVGLPQPLSIGVNGGTTHVPVGIANRILVLSVPYGSGWKVSYAGKRLHETKVWGWASGYTVPTQAGELRITRASTIARGGFLVTLAAIVVGLVLAAPDIRRRSVEDGEDE